MVIEVVEVVVVGVVLVAVLGVVVVSVMDVVVVTVVLGTAVVVKGPQFLKYITATAIAPAQIRPVNTITQHARFPVPRRLALG